MGFRPLITVEISDGGIATMLLGIGEDVGDMSEPSRKILEGGLSDAKLEVEASKGGLFGATWPAMSLFTAEPPAFLQRLGVMKARNPGTLLYDERSLANSLEPGGRGNILNVTADGGEAGTDNPNAVRQQEGTSRTFDVMRFFASHGKIRQFIEGGIPERPFLGWHEERFPDYDEIMVAHVLRRAEA